MHIFYCSMSKIFLYSYNKSVMTASVDNSFFYLGMLIMYKSRYFQFKLTLDLIKSAFHQILVIPLQIRMAYSIVQWALFL